MGVMGGEIKYIMYQYNLKDDNVIKTTEVSAIANINLIDTI
ncbi:hypothetical protein J6TS2_47330 [Heyndrickxia sporothermodurans]|nr:hypothetical protein J6TS2_47330 [Heyndrickxia sporothermodurans]